MHTTTIRQPHSLMIRSSVQVLALVIAIALLPSAPVSAGGGTATTSTEVTLGMADRSAAPGLIGVTATHDLTALVQPADHLPGARIDHGASAGVLDGVWGQGGELGVWLGPAREDAAAQFDPDVTLVENLYFENVIDEDGLAMQAGDRAQLALGVVPLDARQPWDRPRGTSGGEPGWDTTSIPTRATATYGGTSGVLDVVLFRADVVIRGGDLDARATAVQTPPLTIPLPDVYPDGVRYAAVASRSGVAADQITGLTFAISPTSGTAVLQAELRGWIPEARTRVLAGGATVKEWHLPITGAIAIEPTATGLVPQVISEHPAAAEVLTVTRDAVHAVSTDAGQRLTVTPGARAADAAEGGGAGSVDDRPLTAPSGLAVSTADGSSADAASMVTADLSDPVTLEVPGAELVATLDPDFRGQGVIAVTDVRSGRLAQSYARSVAVHAVEVDGRRIRLDRGNLVDLRAIPFSRGGGFTATLSSSGEEVSSSLRTGVRQPGEGLLVDAVHDLGGGVHAFVQHQVFNGGVPQGGRVNTGVSVRALDGSPVTHRPITFVELDQPGPGRVGTTAIDVEQTTNISPFRPLEVSGHRVSADHREPGVVRVGRASVLRAPSPLDGREPDPAVSLAGQDIALSILPPTAPAIPLAEQLSTVRVGLADAYRFGPPVAPPVGSRCGPAEIIDPTDTVAGDIIAAWVDEDPGVVRPSIQLRTVPLTPTAVTTGDRYVFRWRADHGDVAARALHRPDGTWTFDIEVDGYTGPTTGEVLAGPGGVIRIDVPREYFELFDGTPMRDLAALSLVGTTSTIRDAAPNGSTRQQGLGAEHVVGGCSQVGLNLSLTSAGTAVVGDVLQVTATTTDAEGQAVPSRLVDVALGDGPVIRVRTGADGRATVGVPVDVDAESVTLTARVAADGSYTGASADRLVTVLRRPSALQVITEGHGVNRVVTAVLTDGLDGTALSGRTISFSSRGETLGTATTDLTGTATLPTAATPRGNTPVEARFAGDGRSAPTQSVTG